MLNAPDFVHWLQKNAMRFAVISALEFSNSEINLSVHGCIRKEFHKGRLMRTVIHSFGVIWLVVIGSLFSGPIANAQVSVFVDFTSDVHNGVGGGPNGIPDWVDELDKLAIAAGVTPFTPAERTGIETDIMTQLSTIYTGYLITFSTVAPASPFDTLDFGKTSVGFSSLGIAPRDPANTASSQTGGIAPANFGFVLDEFSGTMMRSTQLSQISTALAGTGAHELLHSFGPAHHAAYSDPMITPATYGATGGLQNKYIMATGPTGLTELGREMLRSLSPWEKAMLDITGGAAGFIGGANLKAVSTPIILDVSEETPGVDAGDTLITAKPMMLSPGESSGMLIGFVAGTPDGPPGPGGFMFDTDMWKISLPSAGLLTAEVFSTEIFGSFGYDTTLTLLDFMGSPLAFNDDVKYSGDMFDTGPTSQTDPFLLNIPIVMAGDYFLKLSPKFGGDVGMSDGYWLTAGFSPVPEPGSVLLVLLTATPLMGRRRAKGNQSRRATMAFDGF
jgi:ethanolamine utilization microcompartment shell protein EutS